MHSLNGQPPPARPPRGTTFTIAASLDDAGREREARRLGVSPEVFAEMSDEEIRWRYFDNGPLVGDSVEEQRETMVSVYREMFANDSRIGRGSLKVEPLRVRRSGRRESHARRPGHRRVTSSRAGPDDPPGESEPPRRRYVVDDHYLVVAVVV